MKFKKRNKDLYFLQICIKWQVAVLIWRCRS